MKTAGKTTISQLVLIGCLLFAVCVCIIGCGSSEPEEPQIKVIVNGEAVSQGASPVIINDRAMVPMSLLADNLWMDVNYNAAANEVNISEGGNQLKLIVNGKAYKNGNEIAIDAPATLVNGEVMIPVYLVGEIYGAKVAWDKPNKTIKIDKKINMVKQPFPANGTIVRYNQSPGVASLAITTSSGNAQYYVKVVEWESKKPVLTVFIHAGQTVRLDMPEGNFEIKYAAGETWYGEQYLFGPETAYAKADKEFDFNSGTVWRIELIYQPNGNLSTTPIKRSDF